MVEMRFFGWQHVFFTRVWVTVWIHSSMQVFQCFKCLSAICTVMRNSIQKNTKKDFSFVLCLFSVKAIERSFFRFTGLITHFENTQRARYFHEVSPKPRFYASSGPQGFSRRSRRRLIQLNKSPSTISSLFTLFTKINFPIKSSAKLKMASLERVFFKQRLNLFK